LLVSAAKLIADGVSPPDACQAAFVGPLTDDPDLVSAITDLVAALL
jgi:nitric oxide reductase NorQ protein